MHKALNLKIIKYSQWERIASSLFPSAKYIFFVCRAIIYTQQMNRHNHVKSLSRLILINSSSNPRSKENKKCQKKNTKSLD